MMQGLSRVEVPADLTNPFAWPRLFRHMETRSKNG